MQLHFDEGSGSTTFADSSGFNHDGACSGSKCPLSGQAGKLGYDVKFDGSNDEVRALNVSPSNIAYGVTFWFRTDNCPTDHQGKVVCGLYSVDNGEHLEINDDSIYERRTSYHDRDIYLKSGNVCARLGLGGGTSQVICTSGKNYGDNQWHFVAHTFGSAIGGQRLYVDGELRASGNRTSSDLPGTLMVRIGRSPLALAHFPYQDTIRSEKRPYFKGDIDEVTVYPRALSAREVKDAMRSPLAVYPFDETRGASTFNQAVNNGNSAGKCSGAACPAAGVTGMAYNAVKFDGSNDVITGTDVPLAKTSFTIAFWAKREWINRDEYYISQGSNGSDRDLYIGFWSDNKFICAFDTTNYLVTSNQYADTDWHHWACTYDFETGNRTIYRDGVQVAQDTTARYYWGAGPLRIGKARWGNYVRGWVDELGVWGEALSAADIKTLYQKVKAIDDSVTEVLVPRTRKSSGDVSLSRTALHETTTALGKSEQQVKDSLTIDAQSPTSKITSLTNNQHLGVTGTLVIGGEARDNTFVTQVEVRVDSGAWQTAEGVESWSYEWDTSGLSEGSHTLSCRATDAGGNVQNPASITVVIDRTPPVITQATTPQQAYLNSQSQWVVPLYGQVDDATAGSLEALLEGGSEDVSGYGWQGAQFSGNPRTSWKMGYTLPTLDDQSNAIASPTGVYTLDIRATDNVGNQRPAAAYSVFQSG